MSVCLSFFTFARVWRKFNLSNYANVLRYALGLTLTSCAMLVRI